MSGEKFEDAHNPSRPAESSIENEEKPIHLAESESSGANDLERNQGISNGFNPTDPTLDQWTLASHLKAVIRNAEEQNLPSPSSKTSVSWNELIVRGAGAGFTLQPTLGQTLQGPVKALKAIFQHVLRPERAILHKVDGVVKAGEMLVVLGRPGSGCSTLLKALCGLTDEYLGEEGQVRYNGVDLETFKKHFRGDALYTSDVDHHFPHLRVGTTLDFAAETKTPNLRREGQSREDFISASTDLWTTSLGLRHTLKTKVGNEYVRGISGGERRRVSLIESLAMRPSVTYWDNPTRGLDASTSLDFIRILRTLTSINHNTVMASLYQGSDNLTYQFDKVTVLYLGHQIFFGTVPDAKAFFEDLGFLCRPRQTTADFLTGITDPFARRVKPGWETRAPRSPEDFVRAWKNSPHYAHLKRALQKYDEDFAQPQDHFDEYHRRQLLQKAPHQREKSQYMINLRMQFNATLKRAIHRLVGDKAFLGAMAFAAIFLSLIMGSMFFDLSNTTEAFFSKSGVLFFAVLFNAVQTLSEIGTQYAQRPIVQRQGTYAMYHPFMDAIASMVAQYPYKLVTVSIFDVVIYFMTNMKRQPGAFFIFWITTYLAALVMSGYFRTLAAVTKRPEAAIGLGGISVLAFAIYTGYVIPKPSMHPWFKWITYINPLSYAFEILMANEFHESLATCSSLIPSGPAFQNASLTNQVCPVVGAKPGQNLVNGDDYVQLSFSYYYSHVGRNLGIMCVFVGAFAITFALATEFNTLATEHGEVLIFRRGREPKTAQKATQEGKALDDVESQHKFEPLTEIKIVTSEVQGLVKSAGVFTWEQLSYRIPVHNGEKLRLLSNLSGYVKPGTLTAIMGESGAGKTTLFNILAQRTEVGVVDGQIAVNGGALGRSFKRRVGFVQQQDVHLPESTVREALRFSAELRQPKEISIEEKQAYVEKVIDILEMRDFADAVIGIPGRGLNVEQRKKTTIGVELVAKPDLLLFLDEPTSGLDSQSAWSIVRTLRKLANSGQTVLCTIHQPSSVLIEQFDRLLLLQKGGKTAYFGDIGDHSRTVIEYFESNDAFKCPTSANPAEYILDVVGAGATSHLDRDWGEVWEQSVEHEKTVAEIRSLKAEWADRTTSEGRQYGETEFAVPWLSQYRAVQSRLYRRYWRNPTYIMGKVMLNVVAGLFIGFTFYKVKGSVQGLHDKVFATFMTVIIAMPLMNQLQPLFHELAQLYVVREKSSQMYHWTTFVLSALLVEIPYNLFAGSLFFLAWFNAVHFYEGWPENSNKAARGVYMWLMLMFFHTWLSTFGQAMVALAPNPETASTLTTLFASFVVLFCGVLQPLSQLIGFWHWVYHASPYTYLIGGMISTALHGVPVTCTPKEVSHFSPPSGQTCGQYAGSFAQMTGTLLNPDASDSCEYCRYKNGDEYLISLNMKYSERWRNLGLMAAYIAFNTALVFGFFYLSKVASWNLGKAKMLKPKKQKA